MEKRGISPIIATVLLVLIAIIIAVIIFLWAKSFLTEKTLKFDEDIEFSCAEVSLEAEAFASENKIYIVNNGGIPLYGIELTKKGVGTLTTVGTLPQTIKNGENGFIDLAGTTTLTAGDELSITPILVGLQGESNKAYPCDSTENSYGLVVQ